MKRVFSCVVAASLALSLLVGCGASSTASSAASSAASSEAASSVASSAAETAALPDGVYTAEFDTDSSMFHANEACDGKGTLTVENGQMTFHVSLASTQIVNLYLGKASDAADHEADWLQPNICKVILVKLHKLSAGISRNVSEVLIKLMSNKVCNSRKCF